MNKLTAEQKQKYIQSGGNNCPFCESDDIEGCVGIETGSGIASQNVICNNCNEEWTDIYTLTDVE